MKANQPRKPEIEAVEWGMATTSTELLDALFRAWKATRGALPPAGSRALAAHLADLVCALPPGAMPPARAVEWADAAAPATDPPPSPAQSEEAWLILAALVRACPPWGDDLPWGWTGLARLASGQWAVAELLGSLLTVPGAPSPAELGTVVIGDGEEGQTLLGWVVQKPTPTAHNGPRPGALQQKLYMLNALRLHGVDLDAPIRPAGERAFGHRDASATAWLALAQAGADPLAPAPSGPAALQWLTADLLKRPAAWQARLKAFDAALAHVDGQVRQHALLRAFDERLGDLLGDTCLWATAASTVRSAQAIVDGYGAPFGRWRTRLAQAILTSPGGASHWAALGKHQEVLTPLLPEAAWAVPKGDEMPEQARERAWIWMARAQLEGRRVTESPVDPRLIEQALAVLDLIPVGPVLWRSLQNIRTQWERLEPTTFAFADRRARERTVAHLTEHPSKELSGLLNRGWGVNQPRREMNRLMSVPDRAITDADSARGTALALALLILAGQEPLKVEAAIATWLEHQSEDGWGPERHVDTSLLLRAYRAAKPYVASADRPEPLQAAWAQLGLRLALEEGRSTAPLRPRTRM